MMADPNMGLVRRFDMGALIAGVIGSEKAEFSG
jgi:hypothetical protein